MNAKTLSRIFALLLALVMCASAFTACNTEKTPEETEPKQTTPESTDPESTTSDSKPTDNPSDTTTDPKETKYAEAFELLEDGDYEKAYALFLELGDYKDAAKEAAKFRYVPTKHVSVYSDNETTETTTVIISYNENNLMSSRVEECTDGSKHTCSFTYNENGKLINASCCTDSDETTETYTCVYDDKGNLIKETFVGADGITRTFDMTYNEDGTVATAVTSNMPNYYLSYTYTYDELGREISCIFEDEDENYVMETFYNENGDITKQTVADEDDTVVAVYEYEYDEKYRKIKYSYSYEGELKSVIEYTYDEKDQLIKEVDTYSDNVVLTTEFTYDENGNAIKRQLKNASGVEDNLESAYKLIYLDYEYSDEEWQSLIDTKFHLYAMYFGE